MKSWKETTSTSPSGMHLGHHKTLIKPFLPDNPPPETPPELLELESHRQDIAQAQESPNTSCRPWMLVFACTRLKTCRFVPPMSIAAFFRQEVKCRSDVSKWILKVTNHIVGVKEDGWVNGGNKDCSGDKQVPNGMAVHGV
jgi:hypothetical protein